VFGQFSQLNTYFLGSNTGTSHGASVNEILFIIEDLVESLKIIQDRWLDVKLE